MLVPALPNTETLGTVVPDLSQPPESRNFGFHDERKEGEEEMVSLNLLRVQVSWPVVESLHQP